MQRGWSGTWLRRDTNDTNDTKDASVLTWRQRCVIGVVAGGIRKAAFRA
jgi:hypothetical protein